MLTYSLKRLISLIPVIIGVVVIVGLMIHIIPGDPVDAILGDYGTLEDKQALRASLGLNQPIHLQILSYFTNLASGDLGNSHIFNRPVTELILERAQPTVELAITSILVAICISLPLGIISAVKQSTAIDTTAMIFALMGVAIPNFWLGPMLISLFSLELGLLPVSERAGPLSYVLPSITLGTALAAMLSRMTRNSVLDNMKEDYVRTARAKGLSYMVILFKHVLRNASLPLVTILGLQFGVLLTGAIITEKIFDWPGLGSLILEALGNRDYPLVQGCILVFSVTYLLVNLVTDLLYAVIDPRIQLEK